MSRKRTDRRGRAFLAAAVLLILSGLGYLYLTSPTWVTVAVGPSGSPDDKLIRAFAQQLKEQRSGIRLKVMHVADVREAGLAMDGDKAELAVVRPDVMVPDNGLTLAILRDAAAIVLTPTDSGIADFAQLGGKRLGVAIGHEADPAFLRLLLGHFDLDGSCTVLPMQRDDLLGALQRGDVDAIAIVAPPSGTVASGFVRAVAQAYGGRIAILPIETPDAIAQRSPSVVASTIPEGVWGGRPKRPDHEIKTVGVSYRLMGRADADRSTMSQVTESLFQMRSRLVGSARSALLLRAPETETATSALLPNHPGAIDYFQREQQSFTDKYSDWIYLVAFFGSGIVSGAAWLVQRFRRERREQIDDVLDRLLSILIEARSAETDTRLDELTTEIDDLLTVSVAHARAGTAGSRTTTALVLAIDGARVAIDDRRRIIGGLKSDAARRDGSGPRLVTIS